MRAPTITLDDDQEMPLTAAPIPVLRAFIAGNFQGVQIGPYDNPVLAQAIAKHLVLEHDVGAGGMK
jgi:hypothetical protein